MLNMLQLKISPKLYSDQKPVEEFVFVRISRHNLNSCKRTIVMLLYSITEKHNYPHTLLEASQIYQCDKCDLHL